MPTHVTHLIIGAGPTGLGAARRLEELGAPDFLVLERHDHAGGLAASFQESVVEVLLKKTLSAARQYNVKQILVAGGVSANQALRDAFSAQDEFPVHIPPLKYCTDNAAMVAVAGYYRYVHDQRDTLDFDVLPTWPLS